MLYVATYEYQEIALPGSRYQLYIQWFVVEEARSWCLFSARPGHNERGFDVPEFGSTHTWAHVTVAGHEWSATKAQVRVPGSVEATMGAWCFDFGINEFAQADHVVPMRIVEGTWSIKVRIQLDKVP